MDWLRSIDPSTATLVVMTIIVVATVVSWHRSDDGFNLQQVLVDNVSGKISIEKVAHMTALAVGTWAFIALVLKDKMTEGYFGLYLATFTLARVASSAISVYKDTKAEAPK